MKTRSKAKTTSTSTMASSNSSTSSQSTDEENLRRLRSCRMMNLKSSPATDSNRRRNSSRLRSSNPQSTDSHLIENESITTNLHLTTRTRSLTNSPRRSSTSPRSSPVKPKTKTSPTKPKLPSDVCNFCFTNNKDDHMLGELGHFDDITAHLFCLYFSPGLSQNGQYNEGLWGFLPDDIRKELRRGVLLKCSYCGKKGAVVGCSVKECIITFHLPCGIQNGAFCHYHQEQQLYPSYCRKHWPKLQVPAFKRRVLCTVCQEYVKNCDNRDNNLLFVECCHSYYHRECLSKVAYHQGEFNLKCPNCNDLSIFVPTLKRGGIFVPKRESTWELSGEMSYDDVRFRCDAEECKCERGRDFNGDDEWELFSCDRCGANAIHVSCAGFGAGENHEWFCEVCRNI
ncbi:ubiquitin-protein transferase [Dermatophagoides pteronyssinus]|uniref:Ubiquitin-protein transferase n=1 Tax=Dermatophagoides pteronyssinus TaxID=6956 RepID=A0ABQ8J573_DERPT|nr:ubiquitin-protein transferase [Dermatophagoides pteronyssinus]